MWLTDGIVELRQKGASDRLSRELLASVNVAVRTDTIARFLAEVPNKPQQRRTPNRPSRRAHHASSDDASGKLGIDALANCG
jgi:hypothetical protein